MGTSLGIGSRWVRSWSRDSVYGAVTVSPSQTVQRATVTLPILFMTLSLALFVRGFLVYVFVLSWEFH